MKAPHPRNPDIILATMRDDKGNPRFPNLFRKASSAGKGDGNYNPGWVAAKAFLERKLGIELKPVGKRGGQWAFLPA